MRKTYYQVLNVSPRADSEEIRKAYRKKAKAAHPDVNSHPDAQDKFVIIAEAFEILSDPEKRSVYDNRLRRDRVQSSAARAAARSSGTSNSRANQERYEAWVRQAKARAQTNARMSYKDFQNKSRVEKAEMEVFHYMQFFLIFVVFTLAVLLLLVPIIGMIYGRWWVVFLALVLTPVSMKIIDQCRKNWKELNS